MARLFTASWKGADSDWDLLATQAEWVIAAQKDRFTRNMVDKMMTFALGRGLESYDSCVVDEIATAMKQKDYKFSVLVNEIVQSDPFQKRSASVKIAKADL